jgi:hypothetical protein
LEGKGVPKLELRNEVLKNLERYLMAGREARTPSNPESAQEWYG